MPRIDFAKASSDRLFAQRDGEDFTVRLERIAKALRVPMTHVAKDEEFMPVLAYRVDQQIAVAEQRLADLKRLQGCYSA